MDEALELQERVRLAIRTGESLYREFKSALHGRPGQKAPRQLKEVFADIAETLVAFANADGGELLVGVEDDGTLSGLPYDDLECKTLLDAALTHIHSDTPLPGPRRVLLCIDGFKIAYFSVAKGTTYIHLTAKGLCLRRVDRESMPVSVERITAHRLEDASRGWDREVAYGASLDDLDLDLVRAASAQVAYGVSVEKFLQFLDLAEFTPDGLRLKRAAMMLFSKDIRRWHSGCFVRVMTIRGQERRSGEAFNVSKDTTVTDNILKLVDSAWERLSLALSTSTQLTEAARFQQNLLYPQIACREALINAIVHRNYAIEGRGIEVSIYQDRMEIVSPGMLLSTISLDDIRQLKGAHESRNPYIARVLREVGLVRELGEGIRRIYDVMRSNALAEPDLESDTSGFSVTLYSKSLYDPKVKLWLTNFERFKLTENQVAVLALGYGGKEFSTQDIIDRLGIVDLDQVREIVTPLRQWELIERTKNHAQAMLYSKKRRMPKREVPTYRVIEQSTTCAGADGIRIRMPSSKAASVRADVAELELSDAQSDLESELKTPPAETRLFIGNLDYSLTKDDLMEFLGPHSDVLQLRVPSGDRYGSHNRGYAFAVVVANTGPEDLVRTLDSQKLGSRPVHVQIDSKNS
jgi:ATP-dependent DNA helicase RecG